VLENPDGRKLGILLKNIEITSSWYRKFDGKNFYNKRYIW
jgi:hypothetical protein